MTKTANDVATRALQIIRMIAADETPNDDDLQSALSEYEGTHETIMANLRDSYRLSQANWSIGSVPDRMFPYVSRLLAEDLASVFPVPDSLVLNRDDELANMAKILGRRKRSQDRFPNMPTTILWRGSRGTINS